MLFTEVGVIMGKLFNNTDIIWSLLLGMFAPSQPDFGIRSFHDHPKLPRKLKKWVKKKIRDEGLVFNKVSKIVLCSEYIKRAKHCRIAWLNNYYKSIVDVEKLLKSYEEQYQSLRSSELFNNLCEDKSLNEIIEEE